MTDKVTRWMEMMKVTPSKEVMNLYFNLVHEEYEELKESWEDGNFTGVVDGACDLLWVTIGLLYAMNVDPAEAFETVSQSNYTKWAIDKDIAELSVKAYASKNIEAYVEECESTTGSKYYLIKRTSDGKVLKPVSYLPPNWDKLVPPEYW